MDSVNVSYFGRYRLPFGVESYHLVVHRYGAIALNFFGSKAFINKLITQNNTFSVVDNPSAEFEKNIVMYEDPNVIPDRTVISPTKRVLVKSDLKL